MSDEPDKISFIKGAIRENDDGTETVIDAEEVDAVPVDELEDLANGLREDANSVHVAVSREHGYGDGLEEAENRVRELIADYQSENNDGQ